MSNEEPVILYQAQKDDVNQVDWLWQEEAVAMQKIGFKVCTSPQPNTLHIYRGGRKYGRELYEGDSHFINRPQHMEYYSQMSRYWDSIADISIETFFTDDLDQNVIKKIESWGWEKAFIKQEIKSLEFVGLEKSIWPTTSLEEMRSLYKHHNLLGKYAVRKYTEGLEEEERYWVLNGKIYHRGHNIPEVVQIAANRLNTMGGRYYTIDATPKLIVEVNAGESSDRHAVNSAGRFAGWFKDAFLNT